MQRKDIVFFFAFTITLIFIQIAKVHPVWVETFYTNGWYPFISGIISRATSSFSISVGEWVLIGLIICCIYRCIQYIFRKRSVKDDVKYIVKMLCFIYMLFYCIWGLNYYRLPLAQSLDLNVQAESDQVVYEVFVSHIERANALRQELELEGMQQPYSIWSGYKALPERFQSLVKNSGHGKHLLSSLYFSYAGIAGIYNPFFAEPNINGMQAEFMLPCVEAHEMAHLQGVAREDEANYISVMVCLSHEKPLVQYSGHLLAIIHLSNVLYELNPDLWCDAELEISDLVRKDLNKNNAFWKTYEGWFQNASDDMNDAYLKVNGQIDGVQSYGRMVDLLLATYKDKELHSIFYGK